MVPTWKVGVGKLTACSNHVVSAEDKMLEKFVAYTVAPLEPNKREVFYRHWSRTSPNSCGKSCLFAGVLLSASVWLFLIFLLGITVLGVFK